MDQSETKLCFLSATSSACALRIGVASRESCFTFNLCFSLYHLASLPVSLSHPHPDALLPPPTPISSSPSLTEEAPRENFPVEPPARTCLGESVCMCVSVNIVPRGTQYRYSGLYYVHDQMIRTRFTTCFYYTLHACLYMVHWNKCSHRNMHASFDTHTCTPAARMCP